MLALLPDFRHYTLYFILCSPFFPTSEGDRLAAAHRVQSVVVDGTSGRQKVRLSGPIERTTRGASDLRGAYKEEAASKPWRSMGTRRVVTSCTA